MQFCALSWLIAKIKCRVLCENVKTLTKIKMKSKNGYRFENSCFAFPKMDFVSIYRSLFRAVALKLFQ